MRSNVDRRQWGSALAVAVTFFWAAGAASVTRWRVGPGFMYALTHPAYSYRALPNLVFSEP